MTTEEEVWRRFVSADPARQQDAAAPADGLDYLATLRTRSDTMTIVDTKPTAPHEPPKRASRWMAVAASITVVVAGVLALLAATDNDDSVPADQPDPQRTAPTETAPPPEESARADDLAVGEALIAGLDAGDADAVVGLFHEDAVVELNTARSVAEIPAVLDYWELEGAGFAVESCEPGNSYPVVCTARFTNTWVTTEDEPVTVTFQIRIQDGLISQLGTSGSQSYGTAVIDPYWEFIGERGADDLATMIAEDPDSVAPLGPALSDESLALHEQYIAEFVASRFDQN